MHKVGLETSQAELGLVQLGGRPSSTRFGSSTSRSRRQARLGSKAAREPHHVIYIYIILLYSELLVYKYEIYRYY
jgi:hypothetical protein